MCQWSSHIERANLLVCNHNRAQQCGDDLLIWYYNTPDSKVYGANMGHTWGRQAPGGPHVGPMNFAISDRLTDMDKESFPLFHVEYNNLSMLYFN